MIIVKICSLVVNAIVKTKTENKYGTIVGAENCSAQQEGSLLSKSVILTVGLILRNGSNQKFFSPHPPIDSGRESKICE